MTSEIIIVNDIIDILNGKSDAMKDTHSHTICEDTIVVRGHREQGSIYICQNKTNRLITILPIIRNEIYAVATDAINRSHEVEVRDFTIEDTYWNRLIWVLGLTSSHEIHPNMTIESLSYNSSLDVRVELFNQLIILYNSSTTIPQAMWYSKNGMMDRDRLLDILHTIVYGDDTIFNERDQFNTISVIRRAAIVLEMLKYGSIKRKLLW